MKWFFLTSLFISSIFSNTAYVMKEDQNIDQLLSRTLAFNKEREWEQFRSPKNLAMNLATEVGELIEPFRWLTEEQSYQLDEKALEEVRDEIGDVFRNLVYLSHKLGIDPVQAAHQKLEKMESKYPKDLSRGKILKYTAYEDVE
jgi:NTP pyrophosphatase (non-canonical NTP hydrolase)